MKGETFGEACRGARISCHCQCVSRERPERGGGAGPQELEPLECRRPPAPPPVGGVDSAPKSTSVGFRAIA